MSNPSMHQCLHPATLEFPLELSLIDASHSRSQMICHWHEEWEFLIILKGSFLLTVDSVLYVLQTGDCACLSSNVIHGGTPLNAVYQSMTLNPDYFLKPSLSCRSSLEMLLTPDTFIPPHLLPGTREWFIIQHLFQVIQQPSAGYELTVTGLLWQFLGEICRQHLFSRHPASHWLHKKHSQQIKYALQKIHRDYASPLTLQDLASSAGLEKKYFCKVFHQVTGRTPFQYLNFYRIECAAKLLSDTERSITDIALSCGFKDLNYFTKVFGKYKEMNPMEFRKLSHT